MPFIPLVMDSYYNYLSGNYNESIINCATSLESYLQPKLFEYFKSLLYSKNITQIESTMRSLFTSVKYEIIFGIDESSTLSHLPNLLKDLKGISRIRNKVIHSGYTISRKESISAINTTCKFFQASFWNDEGIQDN